MYMMQEVKNIFAFHPFRYKTTEILKWGLKKYKTWKMQKSETNSNINVINDKSIKPSQTFNGFESLKAFDENDDALKEIEELGIDIQSKKSNIEHLLNATHDTMQNLFQTSSRCTPVQAQK